MNSKKLVIQSNERGCRTLDGFCDLLEKGLYLDLTLRGKTHSIKVHKVVVATMSPILSRHIEKEDFVAFNDLEFPAFKSLVEYMYCGETSITEDKVSSFLHIAKLLELNGLKAITKEELIAKAAQPPAFKVPVATVLGRGRKRGRPKRGCSPYSARITQPQPVKKNSSLQSKPGPSSNGIPSRGRKSTAQPTVQETIDDFSIERFRMVNDVSLWSIHMNTDRDDPKFESMKDVTVTKAQNDPETVVFVDTDTEKIEEHAISLEQVTMIRPVIDEMNSLKSEIITLDRKDENFSRLRLEIEETRKRIADLIGCDVNRFAKCKNTIQWDQARQSEQNGQLNGPSAHAPSKSSNYRDVSNYMVHPREVLGFQGFSHNNETGMRERNTYILDEDGNINLCNENNHSKITEPVPIQNPTQMDPSEMLFPESYMPLQDNNGLNYECIGLGDSLLSGSTVFFSLDESQVIQESQMIMNSLNENSNCEQFQFIPVGYQNNPLSNIETIGSITNELETTPFDSLGISNFETNVPSENNIDELASAQKGNGNIVSGQEGIGELASIQADICGLESIQEAIGELESVQAGICESESVEEANDELASIQEGIDEQASVQENAFSLEKTDLRKNKKFRENNCSKSNEEYNLARKRRRHQTNKKAKNQESNQENED